MTQPTEEHIAELRRVNDSHAATRQRLREAGERVQQADAMRRAAIAEMGQAIRDHRTALDGTDIKGMRIYMDDAEQLTGLTRRTLSEAVGNTDTRSDREVAAEYRAYGYDLHYGGEELHRRHPQLAGLHEAWMLLLKAEAERWHEEHPDRWDEPLGEPTIEQKVLKREYERRVDLIADGLPTAPWR